MRIPIERRYLDQRMPTIYLSVDERKLRLDLKKSQLRMRAAMDRGDRLLGLSISHFEVEPMRYILTAYFNDGETT